MNCGCWRPVYAPAPGPSINAQRTRNFESRKHQRLTAHGSPQLMGTAAYHGKPLFINGQSGQHSHECCLRPCASCHFVSLPVGHNPLVCTQSNHHAVSYFACISWPEKTTHTHLLPWAPSRRCVLVRFAGVCRSRTFALVLHIEACL